MFSRSLNLNPTLELPLHVTIFPWPRKIDENRGLLFKQICMYNAIFHVGPIYFLKEQLITRRKVLSTLFSETRISKVVNFLMLQISAFRVL